MTRKHVVSIGVMWLLVGCSGSSQSGAVQAGSGAVVTAGVGATSGMSGGGAGGGGMGVQTAGTPAPAGAAGPMVPGRSGGMAASAAGAMAGSRGTATPGIAGGATAGMSGPAGGGGAATAGMGAAPSGAAPMPSAGCGKAPPASMRYSMDVGGMMREYILAVPANYDPSRAYKLIFAWHPLGGSAMQVAGSGARGYYGLQAQSNNEAILVAPEGLPFQGSSLGWPNTNGRDVAFLRAMLERFGAELCIDKSRVFSTGFSFGGMMSFTAGCAAGDVIRAIVPMAGNSMFSNCQMGNSPVAVMGFHGTNDNVVSVDSGRRARDAFVQRNKCTPETMPVQPSWCEGLAANNQPCNCVSYQGCSAGYPVIWCEFNASHTPAPNSAATIWSFFSQF